MDSILTYKQSPQDDYYQILGCDELSTTEQICTEYRVRAINCHPDKNPDDRDAVNKFATLQRAKEVICDPELRAQYDMWRRSGLAMPYEAWKTRKDTMRTSLHWAMKTKKEPMIEAPVSDLEQRQQCSSHDTTFDDDSWYPRNWQRECDSNALSQFRRYEI